MKRPIFVRHLFVVLCAICMVAGCASTNTLEARKQERYGAYQSLSPEMRAAVDQGRIKAGMPEDAVYIAWGKPSQVVSGGNELGESVTWIYEGGFIEEGRYWGRRGLHYTYFPGTYVRAQVIFVNRVVREWQTFPEPNY